MIVREGKPGLFRPSTPQNRRIVTEKGERRRKKRCKRRSTVVTGGNYLLHAPTKCKETMRGFT